jgi:hypothetical protein
MLLTWNSFKDGNRLQIRRPGFDSRYYQKKNSGFGKGSTQPREYNWGATWYKSSGSSRKPRIRPAVKIHLTDHVAPSIRKKLAITSPTSGGRSVGIVHSRTQTMDFSFFLYIYTYYTYCISPWLGYGEEVIFLRLVVGLQFQSSWHSSSLFVSKIIGSRFRCFQMW